MQETIKKISFTGIIVKNTNLIVFLLLYYLMKVFQPEEIFNCFFVIYLCLFSNDRSRLLFKSKSVVYNNL